jgi:hypothetical protein
MFEMSVPTGDNHAALSALDHAILINPISPLPSATGRWS